MADLLPPGPLLLSLAAVLGLVISDLRGFRPGRYLCKPVAAAAFILLALAVGALDTTFGQWMLAALALCLVGDLCLMPDSDKTFLAGLGAFLLGHLLFGVAFLQLPLSTTGLLVSLPLVLLLLLVVRPWLLPSVPADMKGAVIAYVVVIGGMLLCAGATAGNPGAVAIIIGAWGFAISDLAVARQQFVKPSKWNGLWGTPLYFAAQMVLAASIGLVTGTVA